MEKQVEAKFKTGFETNIREVEEPVPPPRGQQESTGRSSTSMFDASYDRNGIIEFMCKEHDFSNERIEKSVDKLAGFKNQSKQKGMDKWLK